MTGEGQAGTHGRVNLTEENALRDWSARFGVTEPRLFAAVLAAGDDADEVEAYLAKGGGRVLSWRDQPSSAPPPAPPSGQWDTLEGNAAFSLRPDVTGRDEGIVLRPGPTLPDHGGR